MSARKASSSLQKIPVRPALTERATGPSELPHGALDWSGAVHLQVDRAEGISAPHWHQQVRTGLLERALVLGFDHREGPHEERPEIGRRLLAHLDALGEAGLSFTELGVFTEEADLAHPGALWIITLLFGCLDRPDPFEALDAWLRSLDEDLFLGYEAVKEVAEALQIQPDPALLRGASRWTSGSSPALAAIALEASSIEMLPPALLAHLARDERALVQVAVERLLARTPREARPSLPARPSWSALAVPALAGAAAQARVLDGDPEPLLRLRSREGRALHALGPHALDLLAMAGNGSDGELAHSLALGLPSTTSLLSAMGRAGLPSLLPRLLAELDDDQEDEAHEALTTMLGPGPLRPSRVEWEQRIAALPAAREAARLRGGKAHALSSVLEEAARPGLSERDLRLREGEVQTITGRQTTLAWGAFGVSLEGARSELARSAR